jgi:hypothetical protein
MSKAILYPLFVLLLSFNRNEDKSIDAYQITQIIPDFDGEGRIHGYDTSNVQVFYFKDLILYKLMYLHSLTENDVVKIIDERRTHYILFKRNEQYGFDFDEHKTPFKRAILVDSAFSGEWSKQTKLYPMFVNLLPKLITSRSNGDSLIETYKMRDKKDSIDAAECELKFTSSIKNIELTLSRELDSTKNMKLYELSFVANPEYMKSYGIVSGKYYSYYHLEKLKDFDREYIMKLFDSYN